MINTLRRLLPDSTAWRLVVDRLLKRYLTGVVSVGVEARSYIDDVYDDIFPQTTRRLSDWQEMFGLDAVGTEQQQRNDLAAEWAAQGGQSPEYLQSVLHTAGFTQMYVHDSFKQLSINKATPDGAGYRLYFPSNTPYGFDFGNGGEHLIFADDGTVEHYRLTVPGSLVDGAVFVGSFAPPNPVLRDVRWKHGGDGFFVTDFLNGLVREFTMSTRWDVTSSVAGKTLATATPSPFGLAFRPDGLALYTGDATDGEISEWAMSVPWDLETAVKTNTLSVGAQDVATSALEWGERGTKLYVLGSLTGKIYQYSALSAYAISGMSYDGVSLDIAAAFPTNNGPVAFRIGGNLKLYISDLTDKSIYQWSRTLERHNPRDYTNDPAFGLTQCGDVTAQCGESQAVCDRLLVNEVWYIVNKTLTREAPPKVPDDPLLHGHFWYVGGATFGDAANLPAVDRNRFERLLLKMGPAEQWIVTLLNVTA